MYIYETVKEKILESILKVAKIKLNIRRFSLFGVESSCRMFTCQSVPACILNLALMKILKYMASCQLPLQVFNCQVAEQSHEIIFSSLNVFLPLFFLGLCPTSCDNYRL